MVQMKATRSCLWHASRAPDAAEGMLPRSVALVKCNNRCLLTTYELMEADGPSSNQLPLGKDEAVTTMNEGE